MNLPRFSKVKVLRALNLVDSSLATLKQKGNLGYVNEIYNPENFFESVHHITFYSEDSKVQLENKTIKVDVLKRIVNRPLWHPANFLFFLIQIIKITIRNRISVIRGRSISLAGLLGLLTGKMLMVPFVVSLGGNNRLDRELTFGSGKELTLKKKLKKTFADLVEIFVLRNADGILAPNVYTKNYALSLKVDEDKIKVVGFILKRDVFEKKVDKSEINRLVRQFDLNLKNSIVLYVGRLDVYKQVDVIMESIPLILQEKPNAQFVFIGDGPLREKLKNRAKTLGVADRVYFLSFQPTSVVKVFLSISSVIWIPMSGFVVFEAAAFGTPIVVFDIEWHSEFISNEVTGLVVENRNYRKMAEAVIRMLNDPALARKCSEEARRRLMEEYNPEFLKKKEIDFYKKVLHIL